MKKKKVVVPPPDRCKICGAVMQPGMRLRVHWWQKHHLKPQAARAETDRFAQIESVTLAKMRKADSDQRQHPEPKLILQSRRGVRIKEPRRCNECCTMKDGLWRYAKSSEGEVYLCDRCKPIVFDRSFGEVDAFNFVVDGDFEAST